MNAYILIGGRSRRMGESKTGLFLDRVVAAAVPVFAEVIAVQRAGVEESRIPTIFEPPHDGGGAIFGVAEALRHAQGDAFILGVDYPLITSDVLRFLSEERGVPEWNGKLQPLCAVWSFEQLPRIEERIAGRRYDLHALIEQAIIAESVLRARFGGEPLMNVNTPEELREAERYG